MTDTDEVDFEVDGDELDTTPVVEVPSDQLSLLVNDLHVSYRVFGAKKVGHGPGQDWGVLGRLVRRGAKQPAVREVKAVRGISFAAKHGEAIGIIGINGSGKSTLLRAIAGLIPPVAGTVHVAGNPALLGVNAFIVQDLGLVSLCRQIAPETPVHASTQMSIHSLEGVRMAAELGCSRVVLARELPADQIARICRSSPVEIEVFGHGALCMCYSG